MILAHLKKFFPFYIIACFLLSLSIDGLILFTNFWFGGYDGFPIFVWVISALIETIFFGIASALIVFAYFSSPDGLPLFESKKLNKYLLLSIGTTSIFGFFVKLLDAISWILQ